MLIIVNQSFECVSPSGDRFIGRNKDIVTPPDWVLENSYFKALCDEGKITCHYSTRSVDEQMASPATADDAAKGKAKR